MTSPTHGELVARWRGVLECHSDVSCALDRALQESHGMGLSEFEVLDRLADVDTGKCRMQDLGGTMYLSQSALSRTVARLESDGLLERAMCPDDRRALFVRLTDAGRARHADARTTHRRVLAERLPTHLADTATAG